MTMADRSNQESVGAKAAGASSPPTLRSLWTMSLLALLAAGALLVLVVLPAEVGWDPTGVGGALGLTDLGGSAPALSGAPVQSHYAADEPAKREILEIALAPEEGMELKFVLREGATLLYAWRTDGAAIYSDLHADPFGGFEGEDIRYREDEAVDGAQGSITAPFGGNHGWYWRNPTGRAVNVTLEVEGFYSVVKEMRAPGA